MTLASGALAAVAAALALGAAHVARAEVVALVSRPTVPPNFYGVQGDSSSALNRAAFANSQFVVFSSRAGNLVPGDTNGVEDVFLRDTIAGTTERISVATGGGEAERPSRFASVSADGRYVVFESASLLLAPLSPCDDAPSKIDVFLRDRVAGTTSCISIGLGGAIADDNAELATVSADGRYVAFKSRASNLVSGDTNGTIDVFVRDRQLATTERASLDSASAQIGVDAFDPMISADGVFVVFETSGALSPFDGNGLVDIYRRNIVNDTTDLVSTNQSGTAAADADSFDPVVSASGRFVAFDSLASDIVPGDANGTHDIYRRDMQGGSQRVSVDTGGGDANGGSFNASISFDGRYVAFRSFADDLVASDAGAQPDIFWRDMQSGPILRVSVDTGGGEAFDNSEIPAISGDGLAVAFSSLAPNLVASDVNQRRDVFVRSDVPGAATTALASVASAAIATAANGEATQPRVSGDGIFVAYRSDADNLSAALDTNDVGDAFRHDTQSLATARVSVMPLGGELADKSDNPAISDDGRWVAFETATAVGGDDNDVIDVYLRDIVSDTLSLVSANPSTGGVANAMSYVPTLSNDGRWVAFESVADDLVAADGNAFADAFVRDMTGPAVIRVSEPSGGGVPDGPSQVPSISADGNWIAFGSFATNLVAGDTNAASDVFLHDRVGATTIRVSVGEGGAQGDGDSAAPRISSDGRYVVFHSLASNLVAGDVNLTSDVFVHDRVTSRTEIATVANDGTLANAISLYPDISGDGRYVTFHTAETFSALDSGADFDIYVRDMLRGVVALASVDAAGTESGAGHLFPSIARDGSRIVFVSRATEWPVGAGYRLGGVNVFASDLPRGTLLTIDADGPDPSAPGAAATIAYTLTPAGGVPAGNVTVRASTGEACTATIAAGQCTITFTSEGARTLIASYDGDAIYFAARSPAETHVVEQPGALGFTGETPLVAPDGDAGDQGGMSVASSDEFVVMGAPNAEGEGAVYVFRRVANATPPASAKAVAGLVAAKDLQPVATLTNAGGGLGDKWGGAVAISPDGATIVIGAPGAGGGAGSAAMFARPGATWQDASTPTASLAAPGGGIGDKFGSAVAVGAGNMIAVGAPGAMMAGMADAGAAHVFNGTTPIGSLAPDPATTDMGTSFGASLAMSGGQLVIGSPNENIGARPDSGAVRLYAVTGSNVGPATLLAPTGGAGPGDKWGNAVAIDGNTIVGGAPGASSGNGAGYVFQNTGGGMTQRGRLDGGVDAAGSGAGMSVAVTGDYILLGAPLATIGGRPNQGRAFVFLQQDGGWADSAAAGSLAGADGSAGDNYGTAVALTRRGAIVGIPNRDFGADADQGQADSFVVDRIFRGAFE